MVSDPVLPSALRASTVTRFAPGGRSMSAVNDALLRAAIDTLCWNATGGYYSRYAISHTEGATFGPYLVNYCFHLPYPSWY